MKNKLIDITKKLISIPSWVDSKTNESDIGKFILQYLSKNSDLKITKQMVVNNRFNIIVQNNDIIDTLVIGHIDTVQPSKSWTKNPIKSEIIDDKLYGLGSCDMKSGIATMLFVATNQKLKPNTMFLFYIDEEYDFIGIKKFIQDYKDKINPKQIISLDGLNLSISNGCRGLIELICTIKGKSGQAAVPKCGVNAISTSFLIINNLSQWLTQFYDPELGKTSINIAFINGGQYQGNDTNGTLILGKQGNIIADICQFTLDIRPSNQKITAKNIIKFITKEAKKQNVILLDYFIRYDFSNWLTPKNQITKIIKKYNQIDKTGYIDIQLLWETFNRVPCFTIGAGCITEAHKSDEFVSLKKLFKLQKIVSKLLINSKC
jgi:acetylornithine deacetylase/succinyl-diaminopimelate desuccinylase-like protein